MILSMILCYCCNSYSQNYLDKIANQAVKIDSLDKKLSSIQEKSNKKIQQLADVISSLQLQIRSFQQDTAEINKFKLQRINLEYQLQQHADTIKNLRIKLVAKENEILDLQHHGVQMAQKRYFEGQQLVFAQVAKPYNETKSFDDLIRSSTELSVERDLLLLVNSKEDEQKLKDLQGYFAARNILEKKYNEQKLTPILKQLNLITEKSKLLVKLKSTLEDYKICSEELKKTIVNIIQIDKNETANSPEIQKLKLNKILSVLSSYIFNYDYNMNDYPYLSGILLEIIKRKQPDANTDISDLLELL